MALRASFSPGTPGGCEHDHDSAEAIERVLQLVRGQSDSAHDAYAEQIAREHGRHL